MLSIPTEAREQPGEPFVEEEVSEGGWMSESPQSDLFQNLTSTLHIIPVPLQQGLEAGMVAEEVQITVP